MLINYGELVIEGRQHQGLPVLFGLGQLYLSPSQITGFFYQHYTSKNLNGCRSFLCRELAIRDR